nr:hypothetical protein [Tanacetum cinerariifolium]
LFGSSSSSWRSYGCIRTTSSPPGTGLRLRRTRGGSDTSITPPTATATPKQTAAATPKLTAAAKGKQTAKAPKAKSLSAPSEVARTEAQQLKIVLKRSRQ